MMLASIHARFIDVMYYMETTMSSVGYGDMYPITAMEKIYGMIFMLGGSIIFVRVLANFMGIIENL